MDFFSIEKRLGKFFLKKALGRFLAHDINLSDLQLTAGTITLSNLILNAQARLTKRGVSEYTFCWPPSTLRHWMRRLGPGCPSTLSAGRLGRWNCRFRGRGCGLPAARWKLLTSGWLSRQLLSWTTSMSTTTCPHPWQAPLWRMSSCSRSWLLRRRQPLRTISSTKMRWVAAEEETLTCQLPQQQQGIFF